MPAEAVAYCPDAPEFEPWLTATEVLAASAGLLGKQRGPTALREMLARLGLAAGLIGDPRVLLADEPAAALDPAGCADFAQVVRSLSPPVEFTPAARRLTCHQDSQGMGARRPTWARFA